LGNTESFTIRLKEKGGEKGSGAAFNPEWGGHSNRGGKVKGGSLLGTGEKREVSPPNTRQRKQQTKKENPYERKDTSRLEITPTALKGMSQKSDLAAWVQKRYDRTQKRP